MKVKCTHTLKCRIKFAFDKIPLSKNEKIIYCPLTFVIVQFDLISNDENALSIAAIDVWFSSSFSSFSAYFAWIFVRTNSAVFWASFFLATDDFEFWMW